MPAELKRTCLNVVVLAFCVLACAFCDSVFAQGSSPNVLLIVVDDLNDWIGALGGHPQTQTPRIDALAAQGTLFTNAHAAGPICHPSRTSFMTGISPGRSGIKDNQLQPWRDYLPNAVSLNQAFRNAGYYTVGYGKVYHGNEANHDVPNWDLRVPKPSSAAPPASEIPINGLDEITRGGPGGGDWGIVDAPVSEFEDYKVATWAVDFINNRNPADPQPFFLAVGLRSTHSPWYFPPEYFDRIAGGNTNNIVLPPTMNNDLSDVGATARQWAAEAIWAPLVTDAAKVREGVHSYLAGAAFADDQVGRMLDALDGSAFADDTIVVLLSDHGYHLSEKQTWQKQLLWEEDTLVPLIFRIPPNFIWTAAPQVDQPTSISAVFPTLLELAGIPLPSYPHGDPLYRVDYRSLVPLLEDGTGPTWGGPAVTFGRGDDATIRTDNYRFTLYRTEFAELYDELTDVEEWFNISGAAQYQEQVETFRSDAHRYLTGEFAPFGYRETCGPPSYDPGADFGIHIWRDCDGPDPQAWKIRVTGGGSASAQTFVGDVSSDLGFDSVSPVDLEGPDVLDNGIHFEFHVANSEEDGADFSYPNNADVCLELPSLPAGAEVFVGEARFAVTLPFNLDTLAYCGAPLPTAQIGDYVWTDSDGDGIQDGNESGFTGAEVRLLECNGPEIAATTTNGNGHYVFDSLPAGNYQLRFIAPPGFGFSPTNAPTSGGLDSNADPVTGLSWCLPTADGQSRLGLDAGLIDQGGPIPDLSVNSVSANEDSGTLSFSVTLAGGTTATNVTFTASTSDGTAQVSDNDYTPLVNAPGAITAGQTSTSVIVPLTSDMTVEPNETLTLTLANVSSNVNVVAAAGTGTILNDDGGGGGEVPVEAWTSPTGGVTANGNQIAYSGAPTGWFQNTVNSQPLSALGFTNDFEVRWTIDSNPASSVWIVGLGTVETNADWTDPEFGLRDSSGQLNVRENGTWRTNGPILSLGDVISIYVNNGSIEYRHNGVTFYTSSYAGTPAFYIDTSFKNGAIALSVSIAGSPGVPPSDTPITSWQGQAGGVTVAGDSVSYSGTPTWWNNTVYSALLSSLGAGNDYTVSWIVGSPPAATTWIVGLGTIETNADWTDIEFGLRSSEGTLNVRESGTWITNAGQLAAGDELSIHVAGTLLEYRLNGATISSTTITGTEDFYIDTAFKNGAVDLDSFTLSQ